MVKFALRNGDFKYLLTASKFIVNILIVFLNYTALTIKWYYIYHPLFEFYSDLGIYDSRTRVLTRRITSILEADWAEIKLYEQGVVARIKEEAHQLTE